MKISLLSIGDELLSGFTTNTNASWIGRNLSNMGCSICEQITVKDNKNSILDGLKILIKKKVDFIILTGGLGSTDDDITRKTLFLFVSSDEIFDEGYWGELKKRFKGENQIPILMKNQAISPSIGKLIPNSIGSARGYQFKFREIEIISLPGVPSEMKQMMKQTIIPLISDRISVPKITKMIRTIGISESTISQKIDLIAHYYQNCKIGYYPSTKGVDLRISGYSMKNVNELISKVKKTISRFVYSENIQTMEEVVVSLLKQKKKTISTAESCTGGLISNRITNISGSSEIFRGSVISYSNQSKIKLLNVSKDVIDKFGAVSKEVASLMSKNALKLFSSDYALSVTGIAGPLGGTKDKPVGLVYIGLSNKLKTEVKKFQFGNDRKKNKIKTSQASLNMLRRTILNDN